MQKHTYIDSARGGNGRGELSNTRGHNPIEHGYNDELVQDSRWPAVIERDNNSSTRGSPGRTLIYADAGQRKKREAVTER